MIKIPDPVLYFYIISSVLGFSLRFFKDGVIKQLSLKPLISGLGIFSLIFLPLLGLLFVAQQFHVVQDAAIPYFAGAAILSYLLSAIGLPSYLRGILLLGASVALTSLLQTDNVCITAALTGLLSSKLTENLASGSESNLDDVLPPFIWLTAVMWIGSIESSKNIPIKAAVILGIMAVSIFMRFVQGPIIKVGNPQDDKIVLKRTVLSATAGLLVLCVLVKVLNLVQMQSLSLLCGAAYFITYIYKDLNGETRYTLPGQQSLRMLIFIGFLTLVATRLYGSFGLLAIAPCAMVAPVSSAALFPGIYCASRVLMQVYLQHYNLNVTGINLTHSYAAAAEYAGFLAGIALLLLMKEQIDRRVLLAFTVAASVIAPVLSNFILHAEPTCSLFVSVIVSCFLLAVVGPSLQNAYASRGVENIALVPALMISSGILTSGLLNMGNEATIAVKSSVLSCAVVFVILLSFVCWFFYQRKQQAQTPATSGESA